MPKSVTNQRGSVNTDSVHGFLQSSFIRSQYTLTLNLTYNTDLNFINIAFTILNISITDISSFNL